MMFSPFNSWNHTTHPRETDNPLPLPELEDNPDEYEVEEVKDKILMKGKIHYLVKWIGWPSEYNQWVDEEDMTHAQGAIQAFEKSKRAQKRKRET
jgi:Chromo (CHRromatin Organisation MOdifier) domain